MTIAKATTHFSKIQTPTPINVAAVATSVCGLGVLVTEQVGWVGATVAAAGVTVALLYKRDHDAKRSGAQEQQPNQAECCSPQGGAARVTGQLPQAPHAALDPGLLRVVHPLSNAEQQKAEAHSKSGLWVRGQLRDPQNGDAGDDQADPPVLELHAAHSYRSPTYFPEHGAIWSSSGQRLSITGARDLRRFFLNDVADVEDRFGENDPITADALQTRDLRLAAELRVAIREACQYEVEPHVSEPVRVPA